MVVWRRENRGVGRERVKFMKEERERVGGRTKL